MNKRNTLTISVLAFLANGTVFAQVDPASDPNAQPFASDLQYTYRLAWSDEFEGDELNTDKWGYRTDSKLWSTQLPENVSVSDGFAHLHLKKQKAGDKDYTGAGVISKAYFRYGYYEARIKGPPGEGWHTSFWMMDRRQMGQNPQRDTSSTSQVELDPLEMDSVDLTRYSVDLHQWRGEYGHMKRFKYQYPDATLDEFHVYGVEFTREGARYFFDGELVDETPTIYQRFRTAEEADGRHPLVREFSDLEHNDMNIWFTSIAGKLAKTTRVDDSMLPAEAVADYVRFFEAQPEPPTSLFTEVRDVIPFERRSRRKFDNAVVADLDQDGRQDLITVEHGHKVQVYWNDGDTFSAPVTIKVGDMHGVSVADLDSDGRVDILVAQGGGDGANPRRPLWYQVNGDRTIDGGEALDYFQPARGRAIKYLDSDGDGSLDLYVTGFPLPSQQEDGANHFYTNDGSANFEFVTHLPQAQWMGYRTQVTDFNDDHDPDVLLFGGADMVAIAGADGTTFRNVTGNVLGDLAYTSHVTSVSEIDFDNDGDFDLFLTRAEPQFDLETFYDEEGQRFAFLIFRDAFDFELEVDGFLSVENLQVTYPHYDVFIGKEKRKLKFGIDRHGARDFELLPNEAAGWPEGPVEEGVYIGYLGDGKWRVAGSAHSRTAAVFGNVTSAPEVEPQQALPVRLLENRDGRFIDVTAAAGISVTEQTTSAAVGDFDNNGWSDLAVLRYGNMATPAEHIVYLNQGHDQFERIDDHGIESEQVGTTGGSVEVFDYDLDGALDLVYSNERGRWHLMRNRGGTGNFIKVDVGSSPTGSATAQSAELSLQACGENYRRKVGATSAGFSQGMNTILHVGLGSCTAIDKATVRWSNGEQTTLKVDSVNVRISAGE